jgi:hypothetical protein
VLNLTWQMILLIIAAEVLAGSAIGCLIAIAVFRSRLTLGPATVGALLGALGFLVGGVILGWANSHLVMVNDLDSTSGSDRPILLRVDFDAGHGLGSSRTQHEEQMADEWTFLLWQSGDPGFQLPKN